ncbi:MAG: MBOAT family protein [Cyanobacteria bacterium P01_G01_bin.38]
MLFNSYPFLFIFLPLTLLAFFGLAQLRLPRLSMVALTTASFIFYAYWNPPYLLLLGFSIFINYMLGAVLSSEVYLKPFKKGVLVTGIGFNLALIGYYKYAAFLLSSLLPDSIFQAINTNLAIDSIFLPLGISFFTFQQITYLADAYQGKAKAYGLLDYSLFVSFFPQLIAGPIVHHSEVIPQFENLKTFFFNHRNFALGIVTFVLGLSKKLLIADNLSPWANLVFDNASDVQFIEAWVGALSYTLQLYFDFSGYSDMAIGLALMFNIRLPINFNSPYKATSITDFWRRWHITLSNFLRDYLYIPLGGSRQGDARRYGNLMVTMLLGGLWHGAGWTFVLWGGLHGFYLSINHFWRKWAVGLTLPRIVGWLLTFGAVVAGWVLFRAATFADATHLLQTMVGLNGLVVPGEAGGKLAVLTKSGLTLQPWGQLAYLPELHNSKVLPIGALIGLIGVCVKLPNTQQLVAGLRPRWYWAMGLGGVSTLCLLSLNRVSEFLYFQF